MSGDVQWLTCPMAVVLEISRQMLVCQHEIALPERLAGLQDPASQLAACLREEGVDLSAFFAHMVPGIARGQATSALLSEVTKKENGTEIVIAEQSRARLEKKLSSLTNQLLADVPNAEEELALRVRPLQSQWESRGPGLLSALVRWTESELIVDTADVLLVLPLHGGGGVTYTTEQLIAFEAVLTNPLPALPEVVRLGWHWMQLGLAQARYQELKQQRWFDEVGRFALILPLLEAAEEVELARADKVTLELAIDSWCGFGDPARVAHRTAPATQHLLDWWHSCREVKTPWPEKLAALARQRPRG